MSLRGVRGIQVQVRLVPQHEAVVQVVLRKGEVGLRGRKGPLIHGHDGCGGLGAFLKMGKGTKFFFSFFYLPEIIALAWK